MGEGKLEVLRRRAHDAKELRLSKRKDATIVPNEPGDIFEGDEEVTVSHDLLLQRTNPLFERCIVRVPQALTVCDLVKESIDAVLMVSCSSNFLEVRDRVLGFFDGRDVIRNSIENMFSTGKGAGLMALQVGAHPELFSIHQVRPMSLEMGFRNKQTGLDSVLHGIRTSDPILKMATFGRLTAADNQTPTLSRIYQGDGDVPLDRNLITSFEISSLPHERLEKFVSNTRCRTTRTGWRPSQVMMRPVGVKIKGNADGSFSMEGSSLQKGRQLWQSLVKTWSDNCLLVVCLCLPFLCFPLSARRNLLRLRSEWRSDTMGMTRCCECRMCAAFGHATYTQSSAVFHGMGKPVLSTTRRSLRSRLSHAGGAKHTQSKPDARGKVATQTTRRLPAEVHATPGWTLQGSGQTSPLVSPARDSPRVFSAVLTFPKAV